MKKSILEYDGKGWEVYCDEVWLPYCFVADDEAGWAECYEVKDGQLVIQKDPQNGKVRMGTRRICGRIEFRREDSACDDAEINVTR
jgi:hypothetical protein